MTGAQNLPRGWKPWLGVVASAYLLLLLLTRPTSYADSFNYARHLSDHFHGTAPAGNPFYDFGHVLWHPLGYLFWSPLRETLRSTFRGDDILSAGAVLIAISIVAGFFGAILLFLFIARSTESAPAAAFATVAYLGSNALLYYTGTGMAYVTGISFQIAALFVLQYWLSRDRFEFLPGAVAGLLLGLSVVMWFPYVLAAAGVFFYALLAEEGDLPAARRIAGLAGLVAGTALVVGVVYGCIMALAGVTSIHSAGEWVTRSRYGVRPDRGLLRMLAGIPRGFFDLGDGSVIWKRLLFEHRAFSLGPLIESGIWKVALFYAVMAVSVATLFRSSSGRKLLLSLLAFALPLGIFAAFLFDATPPGRYLTAFPVLFLALAGILANRRSGLVPKLALGLLFVSMLAVNIPAYSRFHSYPELDSARANLHVLNGKLHPQDVVFLLSYQDNTLALVNREPFSPEAANRYSFSVGLPWNSQGKEFWRANIATVSEAVWAKNGDVWVSQMFLAASPDPSWNWVDGDLPGVHWPDLPAFFEELDLVNAFGGREGFIEIAQTEKNRRLFDSLKSK